MYLAFVYFFLRRLWLRRGEESYADDVLVKLLHDCLGEPVELALDCLELVLDVLRELLEAVVHFRRLWLFLLIGHTSLG